MSKKFNRQVTKNAINNYEYHRLFIQYSCDPWYEGYNDNHHGQSNNKLRSYKSWKYNRKKQYKN